MNCKKSKLNYISGMLTLFMVIIAQQGHCAGSTTFGNGGVYSVASVVECIGVQSCNKSVFRLKVEVVGLIAYYTLTEPTFDKITLNCGTSTIIGGVRHVDAYYEMDKQKQRFVLKSCSVSSNHTRYDFPKWGHIYP